MTDSDLLLIMGTDGSKWAKEFTKKFPDVDEGLMLGWFCNAIEAGREAGYKKYKDDGKPQ